MLIFCQIYFPSVYKIFYSLLTSITNQFNIWKTKMQAQKLEHWGTCLSIILLNLKEQVIYLYLVFEITLTSVFTLYSKFLYNFHIPIHFRYQKRTVKYFNYLLVQLNFFMVNSDLIKISFNCIMKHTLKTTAYLW